MLVKVHIHKSKLPWKLIFYKSFDLKVDALKFERYLKKTRNKNYIKRTYSEYFLKTNWQIGMWRSPVAHSVRDGEVASSNLVIPTMK